MLTCEQCGTDLVDGRCPAGHPQPDPSVVVPAGSQPGVTAPDGERMISLGSSSASYAGPGSLLSEALGELDGIQELSEQPVPTPAPQAEPEQTPPAEPAPPAEQVVPPVEVVTPDQPIAADHDEGDADRTELSDLSGVTGPPSGEVPIQEAAPEESGTAASPSGSAEGTAPTPAAMGAAELFGKPVEEGRRRRAMLAIPLILAVLGGAGVFFVFGSSGTAEAAVYRRVFTPQESHTYRFTMSMTGSVEAGPVTEPMDVSMAMTITERTLAVDPDGTATVEQAVGSVEMTVNGTRAPVPDVDGLAVTARIAPDGRVLEIEGLSALGLGDTGPIGELFGPNSMGPLLPADKVAPGDSWTVTEKVPNPLLDQAMTVTARNRLVERSSRDGVETALIRSQLEMPMDFEISMRELIALMEQQTGERLPNGGLPRGAVFVYEGGMTMNLLQTVEVGTSRPLRITGDGDADVRMKIKGVPGGALEMQMRLKMKVSLSEVAPVRGASSGFAPDPVLSA